MRCIIAGQITGCLRGRNHMNDQNTALANPIKEQTRLPEYVTPSVRVMSESEILSAFQVTAAGTANWWAM